MKILSAYKKEEWTADEIRENITALFGNDEIGNDYANNLIEMLARLTTPNVSSRQRTANCTL